MKKFFKYKLVILFVIFIFGISIADVWEADKNFSELENRVLQQKPAFSEESLIENEFTMKYEDYIDDQFINRDHWIDLKSRSEYLLGKIENNGIVYGGQGYMFEKYPKTDEAKLSANIDYLRKFINNYDGHVTVGIVPSSYMKNEDKLPFGLNNLDQYKVIDGYYDKLTNTKNAVGQSTSILDMKETPIEYYRTDHHWTTVGAYKAYAELMEQLKLPYIPFERGILGSEEVGTLGLIDVDNFLGSYYNKTKAFNVVPDQMGYYDIPVTEVIVDGKEKKGLYEYVKLAKRDKYGMFLYGNNGVTVIHSENKNNMVRAKAEAAMAKALHTAKVSGSAVSSVAGISTVTSNAAIIQTAASNEAINSMVGADSGSAVIPGNDKVSEGAVAENKKTRVLLIKDSFGNSFAPFLTYSFDEVVVVDLRSMSKKMSEFIKEKKYDEVIILYNFMNLASDPNVAKICQ